MKVYSKPVMIVLPLTGNEQLCGSCTNDGATTLLKDDLSLAEFLLNWAGVGLGSNGVVDRSDFIALFGQDEACSKPVVAYCKFTSNQDGSQLVAWS